MFEVVVIGSGQLGSRHVQSIVSLPSNLVKLIVLEPDERSVELTKHRIEEVVSTNNDAAVETEFVSSIQELPTSIDLCIVATSSGPRSVVVKELLDCIDVRFLLLEKVLFQRVHEYELMSTLLKQKDIKTWVNFPRRMWPFYHELKEKCATELPIEMTVTGGNWGLACNGLHYIDIFSYLIDCDDFQIEPIMHSQSIIESKRSGYIDFIGCLNVDYADGSSLILIDDEVGDTVDISISSVSKIFKYVENGSYITIDGSESDLQATPIYQSQLTANFIDALINGNEVALTPFEESKRLHLPFIETLLSTYNSLSSRNSKSLPIT